MLMTVTTTATAAIACMILFLMDVFLLNGDSFFGGGNKIYRPGGETDNNTGQTQPGVGDVAVKSDGEIAIPQGPRGKCRFTQATKLIRREIPPVSGVAYSSIRFHCPFNPNNF